MLHEVASIPGSVGYAEVAQARNTANVTEVRLDGVPATITSVRKRAYPFWTTEYLYTYGCPASGTPAAGFLRFMRPTAEANLRLAGYLSPDAAGNTQSAPCPYER